MQEARRKSVSYFQIYQGNLEISSLYFFTENRRNKTRFNGRVIHTSFDAIVTLRPRSRRCRWHTASLKLGWVVQSVIWMEDIFRNCVQRREYELLIRIIGFVWKMMMKVLKACGSTWSRCTLPALVENDLPTRSISPIETKRLPPHSGIDENFENEALRRQ